jgi:hypothetical protein
MSLAVEIAEAAEIGAIRYDTMFPIRSVANVSS